MRPTRTLIASLLALCAAGCGAQGHVPSAPSHAARGVTASGELMLPAAHAFGEPGFHRVLTVSARLPDQVGVASAWRVEVSLRDAGRPSQTCAFDHPLSGCATVDWSDDPSRPNVPRGGVFRNALTLRLATGARTLFLRQSGALASTPGPFQPG